MIKRKIIKDIIDEYSRIPVKDTKSETETCRFPRTTKPTYRKFTVFGACAAAACLLIAAVIGFSKLDIISGNNSSASAQGTVIPDWYTPQKLTVTTVTYDVQDIKKTALNGSSSVAHTAFNSENDFSPVSNSTSVNALANSTASTSTSTTSSGNITISSPQLGVTYYANPNTNQVIEPFALIREAMQLDDCTNVALMEYGPLGSRGSKNWDSIIYYTYSGSDWKSGDPTDVVAYCMEVSTGLYKELPSEIDWKFSFVDLTSDGRYMSVNEIQDRPSNDMRYDKVYVIDLENMSIKTLTDKQTGVIPQISPNSQYLFYNTTDSSIVMASNNRPKMGHFYNFATGTDVESPVMGDNRGNAPINETAAEESTKFTADQFFDNDRYYIGISTEDHTTPIIVDTATGQKVDNSVAENNVGRYCIGFDVDDGVDPTQSNDSKALDDYLASLIDENGSMVGTLDPAIYMALRDRAHNTPLSDFTLIRMDFLKEGSTPIEDILSITFRSTVSMDGKYVYTYVPGNDFIKCFDLMTLNSFEISIGKEFAEQIVHLESQGIYATNYGIEVSSDNTQVVLTFSLAPFPDELYRLISRSYGVIWMPPLVGLSFDEAKSVILNSDLTVGTISYKPSDHPKGTVIGQGSSDNIQAALKAGGAVSLVVSSGESPPVSSPEY